MRHYSIKFTSIASSTLILFFCVFGSCVKMPANEGVGGDTPASSFDFSTTLDLRLNVNYALTDYSVMLELYTQDPMEVINGTEVKKEGIEPVFRAITNAEGVFNGVVRVPTAIKEVYLYTKYMGLPTVVKLKVLNSAIDFNMSKSISENDNAVKSAMGSLLYSRSKDSRGSVKGNLMTLGNWNNMGTPDYLIIPRKKLNGDLFNTIMYSLPESKFGIGNTGDPNNLIKENVAIGDIDIISNTKINLIFMHEGASKHNTLAYYCYPTGSMPADRGDLKRIVALPNVSYAYSGGELSSGDQVRLKYWNGTELVEEFPAGTTIGWCLITSGFKSNTGEVDGTSNMAYYSNPAYNLEAGGLQHCVALTDKSDKMIALSFEDQARDNSQFQSDSDFNDAVFFIKPDIDGSIDDSVIPPLVVPDPMPEPNPIENTITYSGTLAFEDLWPSEGDYDMNDVVIDYSCVHHRNRFNQILKIVDTFTARWSGGTLNNGFAYQLGVSPSRVSRVEVVSEKYNKGVVVFATDGKGLELGQSKATIPVFDNINDVMSYGSLATDDFVTFVSTVEFTSAVRIEDLTAPPYNPFIVCGLVNKDNTPGSRLKEVHLPQMMPTDRADKSLLGTSSDKSNPSKGIYYVSGGQFVFALNLPITFTYPTEKQRLEQAYPRYSGWVESHGANNEDWYLDAKQ